MQARKQSEILGNVMEEGGDDLTNVNHDTAEEALDDVEEDDIRQINVNRSFQGEFLNPLAVDLKSEM